MWTKKDYSIALFMGIVTITFIVCVGLMGYTIFQYAKSGEWTWILMADVLPDYFVDWVRYPEDWIGAAKVVGAILVDRSAVLYAFVTGLVGSFFAFGD